MSDGITKKYNTQMKILRSLVYGSKTFYDLTKREKVASNSTVLGALNDLLTVKEISECQEGSRGKKPYRITLTGLFQILGSDTSLWRDIDTIAKINHDLEPLIFGKWQFFKQNNIKDEIILRLQYNVLAYFIKAEEIRTNYLAYLASLNRLEKLMGEDDPHLKALHEYNLLNYPLDDLAEKVIFLPAYLEIDPRPEKTDQHKLIEILSKDKDFDSFLTSFFDNKIKEYEEYLNSLKLWGKWYADLKAEFVVKQ